MQTSVTRFNHQTITILEQKGFKLSELILFTCNMYTKLSIKFVQKAESCALKDDLLQ
jgi:hypothetical protein